MTHILGGTIVTFLMIRYVRDGKESLRSVLEGELCSAHGVRHSVCCKEMLLLLQVFYRKLNRMGKVLRYNTAAATVAILFCNAAAAIAAQRETQSLSLGTWSTTYLRSGARSHLAATSLPNHGIAFFAGGNGTVLVFVTV